MKPPEDCTYITSRNPFFVVMGFPGIPKTRKLEGHVNNREAIAYYLETRHPKHYRLFNLTEEEYDDLLFNSSVSFFSLPRSPPGVPLQFHRLFRPLARPSLPHPPRYGDLPRRGPCQHRGGARFHWCRTRHADHRRLHPLGRLALQHARSAHHVSDTAESALRSHAALPAALSRLLRVHHERGVSAPHRVETVAYHAVVVAGHRGRRVLPRDRGRSRGDLRVRCTISRKSCGGRIEREVARAARSAR